MYDLSHLKLWAQWISLDFEIYFQALFNQFWGFVICELSFLLKVNIGSIQKVHREMIVVEDNSETDKF